MSRLLYDKKRRTIVRAPSLMWGKRKENGVWLALTSDWRFMLRGHDALYVAVWRLRLRLMKLSLDSSAADH